MPQITVSASTTTANSIPSVRQTTSILGKVFYDDVKKKPTRKKNSDCSVCGNVGDWWHENDKCKAFVESKRYLLFKSHRVSNRDIIEKLDLFCNTHGGPESKRKTGFSCQGSVKLLTDPSPLIDDGAPNSIDGTTEACTLYNLLSTEFSVKLADRIYSHG